MRMKEESAKAGLKFNIEKIKILASSPITSGQTHGENMETVKDIIFLGFKTTEDCDCSHEIRRYVLLGRKAMKNLNNILKNRDITLLTKIHLVKLRVFPVVTYRCKSWPIKKAECQRIDIWCWRRLLRVHYFSGKD